MYRYANLEGVTLLFIIQARKEIATDDSKEIFCCNINQDAHNKDTFFGHDKHTPWSITASNG